METSGLKAMVLAAGVGSRLDPLTRQLPKPLVPIANRPVMEHIINLLKRHGITEAISNLHHLPQSVPEHFGAGHDFGVNLSYCHEKTLTGDAGGLRACRSFFENDSEPFIVLMGDVITDADLSYVIQQHRSRGAVATIALQKVEDVSRFGVAVLDNDGFITGFQEKPHQDEALSDLASTGIYVLSPEIFEHMPADGELGFGRQLFPTLIRQGLPVQGVQIFGYWSDVGTLADYRRCNFEALEGMMDLDLPGVRTDFGWLGKGSSIGKRTRFNGTLMLGDNSHMHDNVLIEGCVIIGDNCRIGAGARLKDTIVWSGTDIGADGNLIDSVVGRNCQLNDGLLLQSVVTVEPLKRLAQKHLEGRRNFKQAHKELAG